MFLMVVTRVKNKLLKLARLLLMLCLLIILTVQVYHFIKTGVWAGNIFPRIPLDAVPVEQKLNN